MSLIYSEIIKSKDNLDIPLFIDKKTMHSKYAPLKEAETFASDLKNSHSFTVILGLGGGYHIESFAKRNPDHFIVVIEKSDDDIKFLSQIECVKNLLSNKSVSIISQDKIENFIKENYISAFFDEINILSNRAWYDFDSENSKKIIERINQTIKECSGDISVQANFGLIWQNNIFNNLKILSELKTQKISIDNTKTAAVIAAGPSLDKTIEKLKQNRNQYFIIATDTAFSSLAKSNITADAVLSIDGQNISETHFLGNKSKDTIYIFDLQANYNAVNFVKSFTDKIIFTKSGHPFSDLAELSQNKKIFSRLNSGGGTVTIGAIDFARLSGFKNIEVFGADFSYINSKPYVSGTYLDILYRKSDSKLKPAENLFTNLLYRTPIEKTESGSEKIIRTQILDLYRKTFLEWIENNGCSYKYDSFIYYISCGISNNPVSIITNQSFDYKLFIDYININLKAVRENSTYRKTTDLANIEIALLPLISYLKNRNKNMAFVECLKLANNIILGYTKVL